jgi:HSP20 family molecular chaperone IbpA
MAEKGIITRQQTVPAGRENVRAPENYLRPAVDIFETEDNLTLVADLPGVDKERLNVNLERGVLTINGAVEPMKRGEGLFQEFSMANYYRQFQMSEDVNPDKATAEFRNGVLTLVLPKSEAAKPRRIEIRH